jgi:hypothetical protein
VAGIAFGFVTLISPGGLGDGIGFVVGIIAEKRLAKPAG